MAKMGYHHHQVPVAHHVFIHWTHNDKEQTRESSSNRCGVIAETLCLLPFFLNWIAVVITMTYPKFTFVTSTVNIFLILYLSQ
jgi:hypothetical protein